MGFEIAAVRVLTPYFGSTMFTWGAIISTFLAGSTIGYWIGGKHADKENSKLMIIIYLVVGLITVSAVTTLSPILTAFSGLPSNIGIISGCLLLYLIPNISLSAIVPSVTKEGLNLSFSGTQIGKFHMISAVGSIAGTILVTFLLLPNTSLEVVFSLFTFGLIVALLIYLAKVFKKKMVLIVPLFVFCWLPFVQTQDSKYDGPSTRLIAEGSSVYHNVYIVESEVLNGVPGEYRFMQFGPNSIQGGINFNEPDKAIFKYTRHLMEVGTKNVTNLNRVFIIGHGVGTTPQYFEKMGSDVTTVEIDPVVVEMSRKYFTYDGDSVVIGDGRKALIRQLDDSIDYMILDAYSNDVIPFHLTTNEFFGITKDKLTDHGVLAINVMGKLREDEVLEAIYTTIANQFPFIRVYANTNVEDEVQNVTIIASNSLIEKKIYDEYFEVHLNSGEIIKDSSTKFSRLN